MFGWFKKKKDVELLKEETKKSFDSVKNDISSVGEWINHLDSGQKKQKEELDNIKEILSTIYEEIDGLKNVVSIMNDLKPKPKFKSVRQLLDKQTAVYPVQEAVQTAVQTPNLEDFSLVERAILWMLLNSENTKLSYEDIASLTGRSRSTIRGQVNTMRSKYEGLIEEIVEKTGKKRLYIPDEIKEKLLKKAKVRVGKAKKSAKT